MASLDEYLALIPQQHASRPRFIASLSAVLQPLVDTMDVLSGMPAAFDLDTAEGAQLDAVGLWVGVSRIIIVPITGVFFSWDTSGVGWDQGKWRGRLDNTSSAVTLDDPTFRMLIRARIAANHWDGTLAGAAAAYADIFPDQNTHVFIQDNQDHTWTLNIAGLPLAPIALAILTGSYLPLRPVGTRLAAVNVTSIGGSPLFGFDDNTTSVGGWDTGAWAVPI